MIVFVGTLVYRVLMMLFFCLLFLVPLCLPMLPFGSTISSLICFDLGLPELLSMSPSMYRPRMLRLI